MADESLSRTKSIASNRFHKAVTLPNVPISLVFPVDKTDTDSDCREQMGRSVSRNNEFQFVVLSLVVIVKAAVSFSAILSPRLQSIPSSN
jgi:hypothetical protein